MMDGCPIPFYTNLLSPPEPAFDSWTWTYIGPALFVTVVFGVAMNQGVTPTHDKWEFVVDGLSRAVSLQTWLDAFTLKLEFQPGGAPCVGVNGVWLHPDPGLISLYSKQVPPFGPTPVPPA